MRIFGCWLVTLDFNSAVLCERLAKVLPITGVARAKLARAYDVDLTCASTALTGSSLALREVGLVIGKDLAIGGKRLVDHLIVIARQALRRHRSARRNLQFRKKVCDVGLQVATISLAEGAKLTLRAQPIPRVRNSWRR